MLYKTLVNLKHNEKVYTIGEEIELQPKEAEKLISLNAITKLEKQKKEN